MASRDPRPVAPLTLAGMILLAQGKQAEAKARFERVMQIDASAPVAANNLAWIFAQSETNLEDALRLAHIAKKALPKVAEVDDTLGFVYYKKSRFDEAVRAFQSSVARDPQRAEYHYRLGMALAKSGDQANAKSHLAHALRLEPSFEQASDAKAMLEAIERDVR
jgi:Tfp pilus assembly protein PilF